MEEFLVKGRLHPKLDPTKRGFLRHFAAWLIEEDLPFTTGESHGIKRLFKYLNISFQLPSDTTVRNALAKIYIELHAEVVRELSVSHYRNYSRYSPYSDLNRASNPRFPMPTTTGQLAK